MRKLPNNALEILAKHTYNEIKTYFDDPKNKRKFEAWRQARKSRTSDYK